MRRNGFTLVELMIVVAIIGMLTVLAVPSFVRARREVQTNIFISEIKMAVAAFTQYSIEHNAYPPDTTPRVIPPGMAPYLEKMRWTERTSIGGYWDWDYEQFGFKAGVSVYLPGRSAAEMEKIDARIDDGDLNTGNFRRRNQGYIYIIEF